MDRIKWNPFFRFPRGALAVTIVFLAPFWFASMEFRILTDPAGLLEGDLHKDALYSQVKEYLPEDEEVLIINLACEDVFTNRILGLMWDIGEAFRQQDDVSGVKSLTHSFLPVREGMTVEFRPFVPDRPLSEEELNQLRDFCLAHPVVRNVMVSADARNALITVDYVRDFDRRETRRAFRDEVESVLDGFRTEGVEFGILSIPLVRDELENALRNDLRVFVPAVMAILLVVLKSVFPMWRTGVFILAVTGVYLSLLPGVFTFTGLPVGVFSVALFPLLAGIQLTLLAHVGSAFQAAWIRVGSGETAVRQMLVQVTRPCLFACLTTGVGLLALLTCDVEALRVFGVLGATGVVFAFMVTFGPGVALLRVMFRRPANREKAGIARTGRVVEWQEKKCLRLADWVGRRRRLLPPAFILVGAACVPGWFLLDTDIRISEFLNPESPTRAMATTLDRDYGGINLLRVEFDSGHPGGIDSNEFLQYLWDVQQAALEREAVSGSYSYALLIALLNQVWEGGEMEALAVPQSTARSRFFSGILRAQAGNLPLLGALSDEERRIAYLIVRTPDMPSGAYLALVEAILDYADARKPAGIRVSATEGIHTILEAERRIVRGQLFSAWASFAAIGLLLVVLWRSARLALAGLLAAAFPVGIVLGLAGYAGISLNAATIMMAAIVLGVTVDDAVHFVTYWSGARKRDPHNALARTFQAKALPVTCTTIILIAIFLLFVTASFPPVRHFGVMAATALLFTLISVLLCLPSFLAGKK